MRENIIETEGLTVNYGRRRGIKNVRINVKQGEIFGFLGPNGAGKTTTQRVLLDVIRPNSGSAKLFGKDAQRFGSELRKRVGYVPGELFLPETMKAKQYLNWIASLQAKKVDKAYRKQLSERLGLDESRKIADFSKGNKQKVGLVAAFMAKPDLLILDEPTSGLDPLNQQEVLEIVREARDEGRTIFFSSHVMSEVEAVADRVGIIREGEMIRTETITDLKAQQFRRVRFTFERVPEPNTFNLTTVKELIRDGNTLVLEVRDDMDWVMKTAVPFGIKDIETPPITLEEIFLTYYEADGGKK